MGFAFVCNLYSYTWYSLLDPAIINRLPMSLIGRYVNILISV